MSLSQRSLGVNVLSGIEINVTTILLGMFLIGWKSAFIIDVTAAECYFRRSTWSNLSEESIFCFCRTFAELHANLIRRPFMNSMGPKLRFYKIQCLKIS